MRKKIYFMLILAIVGTASVVNAQMRISGSDAPNKSAVLDLNFDNEITQGNATLGLALPRVTLKNTRDASPLSAHVQGMAVYNVATTGDVTPGIYISNGVQWIRQIDTASTALVVQKDSVIGNEVTDATGGGGLIRSGAGTKVSPYTLGVASGGITTDKLANKSVTFNKLAENVVIELGDGIANNIYNTVLGDTIIHYITNNLGTSELMDSVVNYISNHDEYIEQLINSISENASYTVLGDTILNYITQNVSTIELGDSIAYYISHNFNSTELGDTIMQYLTNNLDNSALMDSIANYVRNNNAYLTALIDNIAQNVYNTTLGDTIVDYISNNIANTELGDSIANYIANNIRQTILGDSIVNLIHDSELDGVIGNEVTDATAGGGLTRSGVGTKVSPYTLGVAAGGITADKIADKSITFNKFANNVALELGDSIANNIYNTVLGDSIINYITNNLDNSELMNSVVDYISNNNDYIEQLINSISANTSYTVLGDSIINYITQNFNTAELGDTIMQYFTNNLDNSALMDSVANYIRNNNSYLTALIDNIAKNVYNTTLGDTIVDYISNNIANTELGDSIANYIANNIRNTVLGDSIVNLIHDSELDGVIGNEVTNATASGGLIRSGSGTTASPYTLGINTGGVSTAHLADNSITSAKIVNGTIVAADLGQMSATSGQVLKWNGTTWAPAADAEGLTTETDGVIGNEITNATTGGGLTRSGLGTAVSPYTLGISTNGVTTTHLADNSVTSAKIVNGTIDATDLGQMGALNGQVLKWNGTTWQPAALAAEVDGIVGNEITDATASGGLTRSGAGTAASPYTLGISTGGVTTTHLAANAVTSAKIADGTITAADLGQMSATSGQVLKWNGTTWAPAADAEGLTTETDGVIGNEITNATTGGGLTRSGLGTAVSPYTLGISTNGVTTTHLADNSVTSAKIADGTISATDIATGAVTSDKILNGTIVAADLGQMSATSGQVLKWNGSAWAPAADAGITAEVDGIIGNEVTDATASGGLTRSGSGTAAAPYTLGISTNGVTTTHLADNSVTSAKIVNGTIDATDLGQMGALNGQVLKWNGITWQPAALAAEVDGIVGNEITDATASGGLTRSGAGTAASPYTLGISTGGVTTTHLAANAVTSAKIADGTITAADLGQMSATSGQVLKWNGTVWAPAADAGIATESDGIVGNEVTNATTNGGLARSGSGTTESPYTLGIATGGIATAHLADNTVTAAKIVDGTITNADIDSNANISGSKIAAGSITTTQIAAGTIAAADLGQMGATTDQVLTWNAGGWQPKTPSPMGVTAVSGSNGITVSNGTTTPAVSLPTGNTSGEVLKWNGTAWTSAPDAGIAAETDGIVGNEVTNATINGGLTRSGSGTAESPYTLGISTGGVTSEHIANGTIATVDLANQAVTTAKIGNGAIYPSKLNVDGDRGFVWMEREDDDDYFTTYTQISGSQISDNTITNVDINASAGITLNKLSAVNSTVGNSGASQGQVLTWDDGGWQPKTPTSSSGVTSVSGSSGITVTNGTTTPNVSIGEGSISSYHIGNGAVTSDKILNGTIKAEDLNSMGATSGQSLVYKSGAWAPATTWATPVTINGGSGTALSTGSITTGDYKDIYEWTGLEAGLYNLRLRIGGSTAKFILQSTVAFGTSVPFEVTSNTSNDGTVEIMFNYYYTGGSLKLKAYCTGGCPGRVHDLYLARF